MNLSNKQMIIEQLMNYCFSANHELTNMVYLPSPIKIGTINGKDILCNSIDANHFDRNSISLHVLYNEKEDVDFGSMYDFSYIKYYLDGNIEVGSMGDNDLYLETDILRTILNKLDEVGLSWITYQTELQIKDRHYNRIAVSGSKELKKLSWDKQIERIQVKVELEKLAYRNREQTLQDTLQEMLTLGEVEYNKINDKRNADLIALLDEL